MRIVATTALAAAALFALAGTAAAADLDIAVPAAASDAAASSWDGFHVGFFGGLAAGTMTSTDNWLMISPYSEDYEGYLLGVQAGYNFHLSDNVVGGFSVDLAYNGAATEDLSYALGVDYSGSATARIGLEIGGFVPYVLGGISFASASLEDKAAPRVLDEQFHTGYVLGVGGEVALTDNLAASLEYRYTNYGTQIYELYDITTGELADSSVRGGLNFRFN